MSIVAVLQAAQNPTSARGFNADSAYQMGTIDSVNTFSGSLNLMIPLGSSYVAGDRLKYSFSLAYNSSYWDFEQRVGNNGVRAAEAVPNRRANAGIGFALTLGELFYTDDPAGLVYIAPDGSEHAFLDTRLHFETEPVVAGVWYTRDSEYLRLRQVHPTLYAVDLPDGTSKEFECLAGTPCGPFVENQTRFVLKRIYDPFGNQVTIDSGTEPSSGTWEWTIREQTEAGLTTTHRLTFQRYYNDPYRWIVQKLDLEVSGTSPGANFGRRAVYQFDYYAETDVESRLYRPEGHTALGGLLHLIQVQPPNSDRNWLIVPVLKAVTLPDGSKWQFRYQHTLPGTPTGLTAAADEMLSRVAYPTGGAIGYQWGTYFFPRRRCVSFSEDPPAPPEAKSDGIVVRQLFNGDGTPDGEPWRYIQGGSAGLTPPGPHTEICTGFDGSYTTVVDPLANVTINYFSTVVRASDGGYGDPRDYGLPFAPSYPDPAGSGRNLSTKVYKCSTTLIFDRNSGRSDAEIRSNALDPPVAQCGSALREVYVRYDWSGMRCDWSQEDNGPTCTSANRRIGSQRTVYKDDGDAWMLVENTDFDGLGHYRQTTTNGNFFSKNNTDVFSPPGATAQDRVTGIPHGDQKTARTVYNPNVVFNPSGAGLFANAPTKNQNWILNTFSEMTLAEPPGAGEPAAAGGIVKSEYFFDERGFLQQKRVLAGANRSALDLLTVYERQPEEAAKIRVDERFYGGDLHPLPAAVVTQNLPIANPGNADYVIRNVYRFGSVQRASYVTCSGANVLLLQENEIDSFTGLTLSSSDSTGAKTTYQYDTLNRMTEMSPPGEAKTTYAYSAATATPYTPASVVVTREDTSSSADPQSKWVYDHLGRVSVVEQRLPDLGPTSNRWSRTNTLYYPTGWLKAQTTTRLVAPNDSVNDAAKTEYASYDPFGRLLLKKHADAAHYTTSYTYQGVRLARTVVQGTATGSSTTTTSSAYNDTLGRLVAVVEKLPGDTRTVYEYDSANRLVRVHAGDKVRNRFTFDNRGFLLNEVHPELGSNSSGISYGGYDARGNVHERYYGSRTSRHELDQSIAYDGAERILTVKQPGRPMPGDGSASLLKSFVYYQSSDNTPHQLGLLKSTQRDNYVYDQRNSAVPKTISVMETFQYDSITRRLKERTLLSTGLKMKTSFTYDQLGNLAGTDYPRLTNGCLIGNPGCIPAGPSRRVTNIYTFGYLTAIPGFIENIRYHPNGLAERVKHANGVEWIQEIKPHNLPRPDRIRVEKGAAKLWNSGFYQYDAAGSISQIDADRFTYDEAGRLVRAEMPASGTEVYSYDRYGNHKPFPNSDVTVDSNTNRLSTGAIYDIAGNVTTFTHPRQNDVQYKYEYDPFNLTRHATATKAGTQALGRMFLYNATDERVAVIDYVSAKPEVIETWSARDAGNRVIRDLQRRYNPSANTTDPGRDASKIGWKWARDYVFRGSFLVASVAPNATNTAEVLTHVHVDHLGTPRQTSNAAGNANAERVRILRPFGEEKVALPDSIRLKFTGHERDIAGPDLRYGDVDYMHARYYNPLLGRFLSIDPGRDINPANPQSWNLYAYVRNSPVGSTDPTGRTTRARENYSGNPAERCTGSTGTGGGCTSQKQERREAQAKSDAEEARRQKMRKLWAEERRKSIQEGDSQLQVVNKDDSELPEQVDDAVESVYTFIMGATESLGILDANLQNVAIGYNNLLGKVENYPGDADAAARDYPRKLSLVDKDSAAYQLGNLAGTAFSIWAGAGGRGLKPPGAPPTNFPSPEKLPYVAPRLQRLPIN